jgi:hypothetical protein
MSFFTIHNPPTFQCQLNVIAVIILYIVELLLILNMYYMYIRW